MTWQELYNKIKYHCFAHPVLASIVAGVLPFIAHKGNFDQRRCELLYGASPKDYAIYAFDQRSEAEKRAYICSGECMRILWNTNHRTPAWHLLTNKYKTYETFKPYYKRDILYIESEADRAKLDAFVSEHGEAVYKPLKLNEGRGIRLIKPEDLETLSFEAPFIVEECIKQDPRMAVLHPQSVNTVRFVTIYDAEKDVCTNLFAIIRVGKGESFVDNVSAGGFAAEVDLQSGLVISDGLTRNEGLCAECHPNSGIRFKGFKVPEWENLLTIVAQTARVLPEMVQVGWDFALSEKGWCIVEANDGPSYKSIQQLHGAGIRSLVYQNIPSGMIKDPFSRF